MDSVSDSNTRCWSCGPELLDQDGKYWAQDGSGQLHG